VSQARFLAAGALAFSTFYFPGATSAFVADWMRVHA